MFGAIIGDMVGFPYEYKHADLTDRSVPLFGDNDSAAGSADSQARAGEDFSDKTVLTAAVEAGILQFERMLPAIMSGNAQNAGNADAGQNGGSQQAGQGGAVNVSIGGKNEKIPNIPQNAFEDNFKKELTAALRSFGKAYPLAGYTMDLSIWLFREGAPGKTEDAGLAARVSPVAWTFQDDLYMMRHMARQQALLTSRSKASVTAAEAAACAVFLAIHGSTKPYIAGYLEREFGYRIPDEKEMSEEIMRAGGTRMLSGIAGISGGAESSMEISMENSSGENTASSLPALCVRAAMTAFLNGRDFEDVLRRAVSLGGNSSDITSIAGGIAEAFFGIPEDLRDQCLRRLPEDLRRAAEAFAAREAQKKEARENNPVAKERWEKALIRASSRHPAAVQGNDPIEQAIDNMHMKKDEQSLIAVMETIRQRMNQKGRVFVPLLSAKRAENPQTSEAGQADGGKEGQNAMVYRMQTLRTKDGKLWQPAYTSRSQLDKANAALAKARSGAGTSAGPDKGTGMVLSYAMDALFVRFLPAAPGTGQEGAQEKQDGNRDGVQTPDMIREMIPEEIQGIVLNPFDKVFFLPRKTIESIFIINRNVSAAREADRS